MIAFWVLAPFMVLAALGILVVRRAVHAALLLAFVMVGLAVLYLIQDAPFLFSVQIIVYTGASSQKATWAPVTSNVMGAPPAQPAPCGAAAARASPD